MNCKTKFITQATLLKLNFLHFQKVFNTAEDNEPQSAILCERKLSHRTPWKHEEA